MLEGRIALVTGAGTRVGRAIALALGARRMRVGVHYKQSAPGAEQTCRDIRAAGGDAEPFAADLTDSPSARALVDRVLKHFGQLDVLVSSAANFERIAFDSLDEAAWDRSLELNTKATFSVCHQAAPALRKTRGSIVLITCSSTITPMRNYLPYVVSKAALLQLMRVLALELAPEVRVNAVAPGTVLPPAAMTLDARERLRQRIPLARFGSPEEIARAVVFLSESDFSTGQQIVVDGGRSLAAIEMYGDEPPI